MGSQQKGYKKYIGSDAWRKKRAERLAIDNSRCQTCHEDGTNYGLQVHHATYDRLFDEDVENDLITLCTQCHDAITDTMRSRRDQGNVSVGVHQSEVLTRQGINKHEFSYKELQDNGHRTTDHAQQSARQPFRRTCEEVERVVVEEEEG